MATDADTLYTWTITVNELARQPYETIRLGIKLTKK